MKSNKSISVVENLMLAAVAIVMGAIIVSVVIDIAPSIAPAFAGRSK